MTADLDHWSTPCGCHDDCPACAAEVRVSRCSVCGEPAHASETDDLDRCATCASAAGDPHQEPEPGKVPDRAFTWRFGGEP